MPASLTVQTINIMTMPRELVKPAISTTAARNFVPVIKRFHTGLPVTALTIPALSHHALPVMHQPQMENHASPVVLIHSIMTAQQVLAKLAMSPTADKKDIIAPNIIQTRIAEPAQIINAS